jgi:excisionase family DNA binding protein
MFENFPDVLTVPQVAEILRVGRNTAYDLVRSGAIKGVKVGRQIRVAKSSVIEFISNGKTA